MDKQVLISGSDTFWRQCVGRDGNRVGNDRRLNEPRIYGRKFVVPFIGESRNELRRRRALAQGNRPCLPQEAGMVLGDISEDLFEGFYQKLHAVFIAHALECNAKMPVSLLF